ncbi:Homeodomain-like protein [Mycena leptocephala]|nr:Homeodomain-like protein [Mycena leptocephala]
MAKGKPISEDLQWAIVRMNSLGISIEKISVYTDVSRRQIYRLINRFLMTGKVLTATQRKRRGKHDISLLKMLQYYLHGSLDRSCDKYLEELQLGLAETCGRVVSLSTIWHALKRSGYTMVKVQYTAASHN